MSYSSPEGIILGKGSKLVSSSLSINNEIVYETEVKQKAYTEKEMHLLIDEYQNYLVNINDIPLNFKDWFNSYKKHNDKQHG